MADLKLGSKGKDVIAVQKALLAFGIKPKVRTNGVFDKTTAEAVKAYQKKNGLKVDGIVGNKTRGKLDKVAKGRKKKVASKTPDYAKLMKDEAKRFEKARKSGADVVAEIKRNPDPAVQKIHKDYLTYYRNLHKDYAKWVKVAKGIVKLQKEHRAAIRSDPWTAEELVEKIEYQEAMASWEMRLMNSDYEIMADHEKVLKRKHDVAIAA